MAWKGWIQACFALYTPEVVAHWCAGLVCLTRVSIQTMKVVFGFTVFYVHIKVTCPVNHNTNGPSLSAHKHIMDESSLLSSQETKGTKDQRTSCAVFCLLLLLPTTHQSKGFRQQTYLEGYRFKTEARQFDYISQSEYGAEWRIFRIVQAFADVIRINTLNQVTPERRHINVFRRDKWTILSCN